MECPVKDPVWVVYQAGLQIHPLAWLFAVPETSVPVEVGVVWLEEELRRRVLERMMITAAVSRPAFAILL